MFEKVKFEEDRTAIIIKSDKRSMLEGMKLFSGSEINSGENESVFKTEAIIKFNFEKEEFSILF